jgi:hypothetical protein
VRGHKCAKLFWLEVCRDNEEPLKDEMLPDYD